MSRYIDADELTIALDALCDRVCEYSKSQRYGVCDACSLGSAFGVIENFPSVDVREVVHGKWLLNDMNGFKIFDCSNCGIHIEAQFNYCPNCGADMRGEKDD